MVFPDKLLFLAYLTAAFALNLFVYMIAEYYRRMVNKKLNPIGFIISMCAISVAFGATFAEDKTVFSQVVTVSLTVASVASLLNGLELYFFTHKKGGAKDEEDK